MERVIDGRRVLASARADLLEDVERVLDRFAASGRPVDAGAVVGLGWGTARLAEQGTELVVESPDYRGRPRRVWTADLTDAVQVESAQRTFHETTGLPVGSGVRYSDSFYALESAWTAPALRMARQFPVGADDSGHTISDEAGPEGPVDAGEFQYYRVFELLRLRPALIPALRLPPGFLVVADAVAIREVRLLDGTVVVRGPIAADGFATETAFIENSHQPVLEREYAKRGIKMNIDRLTEIAKEYFAKLTDDPVLNVIELPDGLGVCVVHATRGGGKIYVAPDESVLFVGSAMDFDAGLAAFREGNRTPAEKFELGR